jgi:hypothetical protein
VRDGAAGIGLRPELVGLVGLVDLSCDVGVVGGGDDVALALAGAVAEVIGLLEVLVGEVELALVFVGDAEAGVGAGEVGI